MSELYLIKYPVISKSGREYRVDVCSDHVYGRHVMCGIFEVGLKRTIFGRQKEKFVKLNNTSIGRSIYDEEKWNYDYVAIAIKEVEEYEESQREQISHENNRKLGTKQFEEWDGRSSNE